MDQLRLTLSDESLRNKPIDLTNCDREPIHIPGAVQPYGFLLCLDPATLDIVQASANTESLVGIAAAELLRDGLTRLLTPTQIAKVRELSPILGTTPYLLGLPLELVPGEPAYKLIMHRYDGLLWLEFEPVEPGISGLLDLAFLNDAMSGLLNAPTIAATCQYAADLVWNITGFDRVSVYRFAPDESGEVIAEAKRPDLDTWLGLHYPASDIPQQARAMYLRNWLRFIANATYQPTALVPVETPGVGRPPDMTYSVLRSVSPIHLEYLRNLGVEASMSISLVQEGRLWGMILCHHYAPRLVGYELRDLCQFVGKTFSALLRSKEQHDDADYQLRIRGAQTRLLELVNLHDSFVEALHRQHPTLLLEVLDCGGAATCFNGVVTTVGTTPTELQIRELIGWLQEHASGEEIFATNSYAALYPEAAEAIRETASGILAFAVSREAGEYVLWFRPEQVQTVTWAGKNEKVIRRADGSLFLSPRQSFESWKEAVERTATPWKEIEKTIAMEIRRHLVEMRVRGFNTLQEHAASLSRLNTELGRSNEELDAFAYVASHDLKEPLRGIHNYALFLLEDYSELLDEEGVSKLQTLVRLSHRMEGLIEALLQLSRVGRQELNVQEIDLQQVLEEVLDTLQPRLTETRTTVLVPEPLPVVRGDWVRLREVFQNLITNAMRYNDRAEKQIEIGLKKAPSTRSNFYVFYVKDNGIGIDPKHHVNIFKIFKRLHSQEKYGGGTGAGLTIAKRMVEKHGGEMWLESSLGEGTTFFFSIARNL
jgi:two-component system, chemotaxis family, sensor kinase Cph1